MKIISLILFIICLFFYSFSNKTETVKVYDNTPSYVKSLVRSTDYLKLHIISPMKLGKYTANKNDKSSLVKSASDDIIFITNKGQIIDTDGKLRPDIFYKAELNGVDLYLTNKGMSFVFYKYEDISSNFAAGNKEMDKMLYPFEDDMRDKIKKMCRMDMDIVGMNTNVRTVSKVQTEEYFNYYYAHCPEGVANVHGYGKVIYENAYDNIDIVFHSNEKGLKYDLVVKPGGNVSDIKLKYNYEDEVYITKEGKIRALNPFGEIETDVLYTYQSDGKVVESNYIKDSDGTIRIITGDYDRTKDLIIDPYIGATYYGGSETESGNSIETDYDNNILVIGTTYSTNFPVYNPGGSNYYQNTNAGFDDVFILKFNSQGVQLWATYYGGNGSDYGQSIKTDRNNNILVVGTNHNSTNFPLQNPGGGAYFQNTLSGVRDAFILKFNSQGVRLWATYYGGSDWENGTSISSDSENNILVTGNTSSTDFPLQNPGGGAYYQSSGGGTYTNVFILKFDPSGIRQWATYYGGTNFGEIGLSITSDTNNNILITGNAISTDLPVYNPGGGAYFQDTNAGNQDAFVLKFDSNCIRIWATYYGGSGSLQFGTDFGLSIATDKSNNILLSGFTSSIDFPLFDPGGSAYFQGTFSGGVKDVFILKFNSNGVRQWATFYGGNDNDHGISITSDYKKSILVTGNTSSSNFPLFNPGGGSYYQGTFSGGFNDAFILRFDSNCVRTWATFYGGHGDESGQSITTYLDSNILITGWTSSTNFPVYNPGGGAYFQDSLAGIGYSDVFLLGFDPSGVIGINILSTSITENYTLYQNYPNPFNPATSIKFDIPKSSHVKLIVYDILGKEIAILVNEKLGAGSYEVNWDGRGYPSGVYFYKIEVGDFADIKKMVLIK